MIVSVGFLFAHVVGYGLGVGQVVVEPARPLFVDPYVASAADPRRVAAILLIGVVAGREEGEFIMPAPAQYHQPVPSTPQAPIPQYGTPRQETHPIDLPYYGASFSEAIRRFFVKYATFSGRASKSEYWWSVLFLTIIMTALETIGKAGSDGMTGPVALVKILTAIWTLATFIPSLAICVRRLHDANKSGWLILLPVAVMAIMVIITISIAIAAGVGGAGGYTGDVFTGNTALMSVGLIVTFTSLVAGGIINIVLMCLHTDPRGVRFDKH